MSKISKKLLKKSLYTLIIILLLYSSLWALISYKIVNSINSNFAGKRAPIGESSAFMFSRASVAGYPFNIAFNVHELSEDTESAIIIHDDVLKVGYSLLSREIFMKYEGRSVARAKPIDSGFGSELTGKYYTSIGSIPFLSLLKFVFTNNDIFYLVKSIKHISSNSSDVEVKDIVDRSLITQKAKSNLHIDITQHKNYFSFQDFKNDIPKRIDVKYKTSSKDTGPVFKKPVPFSIVYGTYLGSNKGYEFEGSAETKAKVLDIAKIYSTLNIDVKKLNFYDSYFSCEGRLGVNNKLSENGHIETNIKYDTDLKIKKNFINDLNSNIMAAIKNVPHRSPAYVYINQYLQHDITKLNIDTDKDPLKLSLDLSIKSNGGQETFYIIDKLGLSYQDKFIEAKADFSDDYKNESIKGALQTGKIVDIIEYLVNSYTDIQKNPDEELSNGFWISFYLDYLDTISNSKNLQEEFHQFSFDIKLDANKAKFGKYNLTQGRILYYQKLFEHLKTYYQNKEEAIKYLRSYAPDYINDPKVFEIIIGTK